VRSGTGDFKQLLLTISRHAADQNQGKVMQKITLDQKHEIVASVKAYMGEKKLKQSAMSQLSGVGEAYLSNILNGKFSYIAQGKTEPTPLPDKYFLMLAGTIGFDLEKKYWKHVNTTEFRKVIGIITEAQEEQLVRTLIISSGMGKTWASEKFKFLKPLHTFYVQLHSLVKVTDLFADLAKQMGVPDKYSKALKRAHIIMHLRELKREGYSPLIILDEGENMNHDLLRALKGFIDGVAGFAAIVLIGTEQLYTLIKDVKTKDKQSGPQLYRRLKAGIREIKVEQVKERRYAPFFEMLGITDNAFIKLICNQCDNYGELNAYIEPAMRKADEKGMPFDEAFFRMYHDIPKN
jgi:predicted XRE-type DNA-binding protein